MEKIEFEVYKEICSIIGKNDFTGRDKLDMLDDLKNHLHALSIMVETRYKQLEKRVEYYEKLGLE